MSIRAVIKRSGRSTGPAAERADPNLQELCPRLPRRQRSARNSAPSSRRRQFQSAERFLSGFCNKMRQDGVVSHWYR